MMMKEKEVIALVLVSKSIIGQMIIMRGHNKMVEHNQLPTNGVMDQQQELLVVLQVDQEHLKQEYIL